MRRLALLMLLALAFAFAYTVQPSGSNQEANYGLSRALLHRRAWIDPSLRGPRALSRFDTVRFHGHDFAAKAPGLAFASVPAEAVVEAVGSPLTIQNARAVWALHVLSVALPAAILVALVMMLGDSVAPGYGALAAVTAGLSTLVLPFATVLFAHLLAAAFVFGSFFLLWRERRAPMRARLLVVAALLGGLATFTDYPMLLVVLVLGIYASAREAALRRAGLFYGTFGVSLVPVFAFNWWAFGSPTHFPYEGWSNPSEPPATGLFGATHPSLHVLLSILFSPGGIAMLAPAVVGLVVMAQRGRRAEAWTIAAAAGVLILHNSAIIRNEFGGASPGPRHLIAAIPFLAVPLAPAFRAFPGPTVALALCGAVVMAVYTSTDALRAYDGDAFTRFRHADFVTTVLGGDHAFIALFFAALVLAFVAAVAASPLRRLKAHDIGAGLITAAGWVVVTHVVPRTLRIPHGTLVALAVVALVVGCVVAASRLPTFGYRKAGWRRAEPLH